MWDDFIAGWVSGGIGILVGHPFDTIKTRLQTLKHFNGPYHCLMSTLKNESLKGLYKGMLGPSMTIGFQNSLLFSGYGWSLKIIHGDIDKNNLPISHILFASIVGTWFQLLPAIPIDNIKTKLQVQRNTYIYKGPIDCCIKIIKNKGIYGLYQGGGAMFWRDNIGYLFYIPLYEVMQRKLIENNYHKDLSQLFAGGIAGSVSWLSITPIEIVKNRFQVYEQISSDKREVNYNIIVKEIWKENRIKGFYKGAMVLVCRGFITNAVVFYAYENIISYWSKLFKPTSH
uniref:Mitochondrial carrier protein n=1 Tax=Parastrongyloides trichosuri TaxID=131310 RepID=A0A0N4ZIL2_PARTI